MARWKIFGRSKSEDGKSEREEFIKVESDEIIESEAEQEPEKPTLAEHRETLYAEGSTPKKKGKGSSNQRTWRDTKAIEENVDTISKRKPGKPVPELDKKVDEILSKKKK